MSDVAADVAAFLAADTTDVLSAAKAADGGFCPAKIFQDGLRADTWTFQKTGFVTDLAHGGSKWKTDGVPWQIFAASVDWRS